MNRNLYTPPSSLVTDVVMTHPPRPKTVVIAVVLASSSLAIGMLKLAVTTGPGPLWIGIVTAVLILALVYALWLRQGWARWVFLAFFVIGLPSLLFMRDALAQQGLLWNAILVTQTIAQGVALAYMFTTPSNAWYRSNRS